MAVLLVLMGAFSVGVYRLLDAQRSRTQAQPGSTSGARAPALAGTIYLAQAGALYQFQQGRFRKLTPSEGWMQPAEIGRAHV